jgi:hypothetical protein
MTLNVDLAGAERIYAVSNVPLFLLRKLQADPVTREISLSHSTEQILTQLKTSVQSKPRSLREAVEPYVLLVALAKKRDLDALKKVGAINALYHDWFSYIADILVQTFNPTEITSLNIPGQIHAPSIANTSTASTRRLILPSG